MRKNNYHAVFGYDMRQRGTTVEKNSYENIPIIPLRGLIVFPFTLVSFDVGRDKSVAAIELAQKNEQLIFVSAQKNHRQSEISSDNIYTTGCLCRIKAVSRLIGDTIHVTVEGLSRAKVVRFIQHDNLIAADIVLFDESVNSDKALALRPTISEKLNELINASSRPGIQESLMLIEKAIMSYDYMFKAANLIILKADERQQYIEQEDFEQQCVMLISIINREIELATLSKRIDQRVKEQIDKNQKEYVLREQIRAIRAELGENEQMESDEFRKRLASREFPPAIKAKLETEITRFSALPPGSHEAPSLRTFIDCLLDLPYTEESTDNLDIENAKAILDADHYGLDKVKERVLEYLAVGKLTGKVNGQIICFVGPPGVGKTSISSSIAAALGRKFVRMSLGGIRDEAEIRGHRRTYIGAMPGRVIAAMRQAGTINPVILFDEIDKLAKDYNGDPAAAILEVLDSAQNFAFRDHFLEMPYDLSKVMFITTANDLSGIPRPLLDRMEVIEVPGYLATEKMQIAARHLIPKELEKHGLRKSMLTFPVDIIREIIECYTREAGVRTLDRTIAAICRKAACDISVGKKRIKLSHAKLHEYLGVPKYSYEAADAEPEIGVVNGLAWTSVGGDTLQIEVAALKGTGQLQLTGQLGDVMQESAKAAITCIRARCDMFGLAPDFNQKIDLHIHVPEGAVPKDGPSAGIAMLTADASAVTGIPVKARLAMTGEITLRGRVLPIGGLREKLLAAVTAGITTVLLPEKNRSTVSEVPKDITDKLEIIYVNSADEVLEHALVRQPFVQPMMIPQDTGRTGAPA